MAGRRKLPPVRVCPGCSREFRSYSRDCPWCLADGGQENRSELARMAREARMKRRGEQEPSERTEPPRPFGELPDGF